MDHRFKSFLVPIVRPLRRVVRRALNTMDRMMHPLRMRRALRVLDHASRPAGVYFVCLGNICRSPYAEARLRRLLSDRTHCVAHIASGGFILPGRPPPDTALRVGSQLGLDLANHRSQLVTESALREAGLLFAMTAQQVRQLQRDYGVSHCLHLGDLDPQFGDRRDIRDPYGHSEEVFHEVYARIDRSLMTLSDRLRDGCRGPNKSPEPQ